MAFDVGGLCRITREPDGRPRFDRWTTAQGLASNNARALVEDAAGRIYVGTQLGVDRLDADLRTIRRYTTADGLASNEVEVALSAQDGSLWFGTHAGLSRLTPEPDSDIATPNLDPRRPRRHSIHPGERSWRREGRRAADRLRRGSIRHRVRERRLRSGWRVALQYRLEGIDSRWQRGPAEQRVSYARLGAGRYRFQVRAVSHAGVPSPTPAVVEFAVRPPVWLRPWFFATAAALAALLAYVGHRARLTRMLELERVRLRIAVDLHDDIGASLSQIAILSEVARRQASGPGVDEPLARVAATSREVVDAMNDIVWAIARTATRWPISRAASGGLPAMCLHRAACSCDSPRLLTASGRVSTTTSGGSSC